MGGNRNLSVAAQKQNGVCAQTSHRLNSHCHCGTLPRGRAQRGSSCTSSRATVNALGHRRGGTRPQIWTPFGHYRAVGARHMNARALSLNGQAILYSLPDRGKSRQYPRHPHVCVWKVSMPHPSRRSQAIRRLWSSFVRGPVVRRRGAAVGAFFVGDRRGQQGRNGGDIHRG